MKGEVVPVRATELIQEVTVFKNEVIESNLGVPRGVGGQRFDPWRRQQKKVVNLDENSWTAMMK